MITLYPFFNKQNGDGKFFNIFKRMTGLEVLPFTCGRSAIVAGLRAFGLGRMDEILVPPFLGQCVLSALSRTAFPSLSASTRTRAILVYHQFGFPQNISYIESVCKNNNWIILNDCANTIFTRLNGHFILDWGDFSIVSLSKLYPCGLGGALYCKRSDIYEKVSSELDNLSDLHKVKAEQAIEKLVKINEGYFGDQTIFEINGLYGYLPDLLAFPQKAYFGLPSSMENIEKDVHHRKKLYTLALNMFGNNVPVCDDEVVPFAIPISGEMKQLLSLSEVIKQKFDVSAPVLHFDYARNMLEPDYRPALVIGCHAEWKEEIVQGIFELVKKVLK